VFECSDHLIGAIVVSGMDFDVIIPTPSVCGVGTNWRRGVAHTQNANK
jgi:hypothetical protein